MNKLFVINFKFSSNLSIPENFLSYFPSFYKDILKLLSKYCINQPSLPSTIFSQYLCFSIFGKKHGLIKENGKLKTLKEITGEFQLDKNFYFKWMRLLHAIPDY